MASLMDKFMRDGKLVWPTVHIQSIVSDIGKTSNNYFDLGASGSMVEETLVKFWNQGTHPIYAAGVNNTSVGATGLQYSSLRYRDL